MPRKGVIKCGDILRQVDDVARVSILTMGETVECHYENDWQNEHLLCFRQFYYVVMKRNNKVIFCIKKNALQKQCML